jgi:hypothetical protein
MHSETVSTAAGGGLSLPAVGLPSPVAAPAPAPAPLPRSPAPTSECSQPRASGGAAAAAQQGIALVGLPWAALPADAAPGWAADPSAGGRLSGSSGGAVAGLAERIHEWFGFPAAHAGGGGGGAAAASFLPPRRAHAINSALAPLGIACTDLREALLAGGGTADEDAVLPSHAWAALRPLLPGATGPGAGRGWSGAAAAKELGAVRAFLGGAGSPPLHQYQLRVISMADPSSWID